MAESGGSKYTTAGASATSQPAKMERPAPVGSNYTPVGRPDIASMSGRSKPQAPSAVGSSWQPKHNELQDIRKGTAAATKPAEQDSADTVIGTTWQPKHNELQEIRAKAAREKPEAPASVGTTWQPRHNELQEIRAKAAAESQKNRDATSNQGSAPPPPAAAARPIVSLLEAMLQHLHPYDSDIVTCSHPQARQLKSRNLHMNALNQW